MASSQPASETVSRQTGDLVPNIVDHRAKDEPDMLYAEYPVSTLSYEEGYRKITYRDFANAINGIAWWLQEVLGPGQDFEALAYIGPNDLRYPALILGAAKAGYTVYRIWEFLRVLGTDRDRCSSHPLAIALLPRSACSIELMQETISAQSSATGCDCDPCRS